VECFLLVRQPPFSSILDKTTCFRCACWIASEWSPSLCRVPKNYMMETSNSAVSSDSYLNSYLRSALHSDITKSLWLEETSEENVVQPLLKAESARDTGQGFFQLGCECHQGWRLHSLSRQPVPVFYEPHGTKAFPCVGMDHPVFQFVPLASHPFTETTGKSVAPFSLCCPISYVYTLRRFPQAFPSQGKFLFKFSHAFSLALQCSYSLGISVQKVCSVPGFRCPRGSKTFPN